MAKVDSLVAPLLERLVDLDARIVVAGDHGEIFNEEKCGWQHDRSSADQVLHVPLFRWSPSIQPKVTVDLVGLADVPQLLTSDLPLQPRDVVLAESGSCDPNCTVGCAPKGLLGRDTVAIGPNGRTTLRTNVGAISTGVVEDDWVELLKLIPSVPEPKTDTNQAMKALGYH